MARPALTPEHIEQLKKLLERFEAMKAAHMFTVEEARAIQGVVETFEKHGAEISAIIAREQARIVWAKIRIQLWVALKWLLTTLALVFGLMQGYLALIGAERWWPK